MISVENCDTCFAETMEFKRRVEANTNYSSNDERTIFRDMPANFKSIPENLDIRFKCRYCV